MHVGAFGQSSQSLDNPDVPGRVHPPDQNAIENARDRLDALATPAGALGRLGELAVWASGVLGSTPPSRLTSVRSVIFAGDHGITDYGVSAYPKNITGAMVRAMNSGRSGACALAAEHGVDVRVLDIGCAEEFEDPAIGAFKVNHGSRPIHLADGLDDDEADRAFQAGRQIADAEISAGAQLLIAGDMGIGNTTPAAALIAAGLGVPASEVTGRGTGIDDSGLLHKQKLVQQAVDRVGSRTDDPWQTTLALGSADLMAATGFMIRAASRGVPVLLDGVISVACALSAERLAPGAVAWFAAGHRSTEQAQSLALDKLGLSPILDLDMRLGEGSGAIAAVPVIRSAIAVLRDTALLASLQ